MLSASGPPRSSDGSGSCDTLSPADLSAGHPTGVCGVTATPDQPAFVHRGSPANTIPPEGRAGGESSDGVDHAGGRAGGSAADRLANGSPGEANPPLLTGGLLHPLSVAVDFLTVSVPDATRDRLALWTQSHEEGNGRRGFAHSEKRATLGGYCWRQWGPTVESKAYGSRYESWEWAGQVASPAASFLRPFEARPSRVDVAFDFECPASFRSDDLVPYYSAHAEARQISLGVSGQDGVYTRYVGSVSSSRRVRIYRRDLKDRAIASLYGPVLRVEVVLRDEVARAWWATWCECQAKGYAAAAYHVAEMTGLRVHDSTSEPCEVVMPEAADEAKQIATFIEQWGDRLHDWQRAGRNVLALAEDRSQRNGNRMISRRRRLRRADMASRNAAEVMAMARRLLGLTATDRSCMVSA
jgi:hypothetical protein